MNNEDGPTWTITASWSFLSHFFVRALELLTFNRFSMRHSNIHYFEKFLDKSCLLCVLSCVTGWRCMRIIFVFVCVYFFLLATTKNWINILFWHTSQNVICEITYPISNRECSFEYWWDCSMFDAWCCSNTQCKMKHIKCTYYWRFNAQFTPINCKLCT